MHNYLNIRSWSPVRTLAAINATLIVAYLGLIAIAMTYAALEVEFTQYTKNDEAAVAALESSYLASLATLTNTNYAAEGYAQPIAELYVPGALETALLTR